MSNEHDTERVVAALEDVGYESLGSSVQVGSVPYEFDRVLVGPPGTLDLVIVEQLTDVSGRRLRQKLSGLARALDVVGSRRSITAVLLGETEDRVSLGAIGQVSRYLLVAPSELEEAGALHDRLSILLPLELGPGEEDPADPDAELRRRLPSGLDKGGRAILDAAQESEAAVERALRAYINESLAPEDVG